MRVVPIALVATALLTTSCSLVGGGGGGGSSSDASTKVVLVTHESFVMSKALQKRFEDESGYDLVVKASGWFIEYRLMERGLIERMTESGIYSDITLDSLIEGLA